MVVVETLGLDNMIGVNHQLKKTFRLIVIAGAFFLFPFFSDASFVAGQPLYSSSESRTEASGSGEVMGQSLGNYFTNFISRIRVYGVTNSLNANVSIYYCDTNDIHDCANGTVYIDYSTEDWNASSTGFHTYTFDGISDSGSGVGSPISVTGKYVWIVLPSIYSGKSFTWYGSDIDNYNDGSCRLFGAGIGADDIACTTLSDLYFEAHTGESVSFIIPNSGDVGQDFRNWVVQINDAVATTAARRIDINYENITDSATISSTVSGSFQRSILKSIFLQNGSYDATAIWYVNNVEQSRSVIYFTISATSSPYIDTGLISNAASTSDELINDFCDNWSWYNPWQAGCQVIYWLFVPSLTYTNYFGNTKNVLLTQFPISVYTDFSNMFQGLFATSTTATTSIKIPLDISAIGNGSASNTAPVLLNITNAGNFTIIKRLRVIFGYLVYLAWAMLVYKYFFRITI